MPRRASSQADVTIDESIVRQLQQDEAQDLEVQDKTFC